MPPIWGKPHTFIHYSNPDLEERIRTLASNSNATSIRLIKPDYGYPETLSTYFTSEQENSKFYKSISNQFNKLIVSKEMVLETIYG